jgi:hypothetical protein
MKIALCLSGQPRVVDVGFQKLNQSILQHNDVDVFIHTWFDPDNLSTNSIIPGREAHQLELKCIDKLIEYYSPKKIVVEKSKNWKRRYDIPDKCFTDAWTWALEVRDGIEVAKDYICNTTNSMFYSMMMANLIKEQYSIETGIEYDFIIRNRIDYSPHVVLNFDNMILDNDVLLYQDLNQPNGMISDWFAMGRTNAMNVFCGVYNHIGQLIRQSNQIDGYWCNELLLKYHIHNYQIKPQAVDFQVHY